MIRKIFDLFPEKLKEEIKLLYYNRRTQDFTFSIEGGVFKTRTDNWFIRTISPLYFVVRDIVRYEEYYKVSEGDIVIDAGANEGILTLVYSRKVGPAGKVFAFEPDEKNVEKLGLNLELNENTQNVQLEQKGLWSRSDIKNFYQSGSVGSSIFYEEPQAVKRSIPVVSIDEFVKDQKLSKVDFIKMDIEGAEIEALLGARKTLLSLKPNMAIASYHIIDGEPTHRKLEEFLEEIGFPYKSIFYKDGEIVTYVGPAVPEK